MILIYNPRTRKVNKTLNLNMYVVFIFYIAVNIKPVPVVDHSNQAVLLSSKNNFPLSNHVYFFTKYDELLSLFCLKIISLFLHRVHLQHFRMHLRLSLINTI